MRARPSRTSGPLCEEAAEDLGNPQTLADIGPLIENEPGKATLCVESEFPGRNVTVLDTAVVYDATDPGDPCNFGEVFTTDGRIAPLGLTVLEDTEAFFPVYNVSPVFRSEVYDQYGAALEELYTPVTEALTQDVMTELDGRASEGEREESVAQSFLQERGLIGG